MRSVRQSLMSLISSRRSGKESASLKPSSSLRKTRKRNLYMSMEHCKRLIDANFNTLPYLKSSLPLSHQLRRSRHKGKWPIIVSCLLVTRRTIKERKNCKKYSRNAKVSGIILLGNALKTLMTSVINCKQSFAISSQLICL